MTPPMMEYHMQRQKQLERAGKWGEANMRNLWLIGAFAAADDYREVRLPEMRSAFLARARIGRLPH
jgi:hypothetical protein